MHNWPYTDKFLQKDDVHLARIDEEFDFSKVFIHLDDENVWRYIPGERPVDAGMLEKRVCQGISQNGRICWAIILNGETLGLSCYIPVKDAPEAIEIGATYMSPSTWGSGLNGKVKDILIRHAWESGAEWILFRVDELNKRSVAAIKKLGAYEVARHLEPNIIRKDGSIRTTIAFRLDRDHPENKL